jgi:hypothetical protein
MNTNKAVQYWAPEDVAKAIAGLGKPYAKYASKIISDGVTGRVLLKLDDEDFAELGINKILHRKAILALGQDLRELALKIHQQQQVAEEKYREVKRAQQLEKLVAPAAIPMVPPTLSMTIAQEQTPPNAATHAPPSSQRLKHLQAELHYFAHEARCTRKHLVRK